MSSSVNGYKQEQRETFSSISVNIQEGKNTMKLFLLHYGKGRKSFSTNTLMGYAGI